MRGFLSLAAAVVGLACAFCLAIFVVGSDEPGKENLDLPFDAAGERGEEDIAPEIILFYGQIFEGDAVVFSCDVSGSMTGEKWRRLQEQVLGNIDSFREGTEFSLVFFAARTFAFPSQEMVIKADPGAKAAARAFLLAITPGGATCTLPALVSAVRRVERATAKHRLVIHLSDGWNYCSDSGSNSDYGEEILRAVKVENDRKVPVNALCLSSPPARANDRWMRRLAEENRGRFVRVQD